ncbi:protein Aster-C [Engraulis encrasicolus]|uniref:protein Aster-C n=1 Tax=Engraulis encrasicolus TaxID=184585 RepID=UPI002FD4F019
MANETPEDTPFVGHGASEEPEVIDTGGHRSVCQVSDTGGSGVLSVTAPQVPPTNYKQRLEEFRKLFKEGESNEAAESNEILITDYNCALQKDILLQGRLYLSENLLCFYSNVFRGTKIVLNLGDVTIVTKEKTARLIPNAIQISTSNEKLFFTSFAAREKSFLSIFRMWQNVLLNKPLSRCELWQMVKQHYGNDLGLTHEDMEQLQLSPDASTPVQTSMRSEDSSSSRLERPTTLRLHQGEPSSIEASTPVGDDTQSSLGQHSTLSPNADESRGTPLSQRSAMAFLDRQSSERSSKRSNLDLNANEDRLSQHSGSETTEEPEPAGEDRDSDAQVHGRLFVNRVFHVSAEKMFELLFTDSPFTQRFMRIRKITGATSSPWERNASGCMKRSLNYTITITNPLVGKFSTATEHQTLYKDGGDGQYLVDAEVYTHDVPYHDYFYTANRYCIIRTSKRKCRLRIYTDVRYKKQPWGLVKSFITKNSWSGLEEYFRRLEAELLEEEVELTQGAGDAGKMAAMRRRRRTYSRGLQDHMMMKPNNNYGADAEPHRDGSNGPMDMKGPHRWNINTIVAGMSLILLVLTVLNLGLFFKLWAMEDVAHRMYLSTKHRMRERAEASVGPDLGPRQATVHRAHEDMHLLRSVLQDSINLLEQLRTSLVVLQRNFQVHNRTNTHL